MIDLSPNKTTLMNGIESIITNEKNVFHKWKCEKQEDFLTTMMDLVTLSEGLEIKINNLMGEILEKE